jgi:hypothetical protein
MIYINGVDRDGKSCLITFYSSRWSGKIEIHKQVVRNTFLSVLGACCVAELKYWAYIGKEFIKKAVAGTTACKNHNQSREKGHKHG